jgi:selenide,water dikinase
LPVAGIAQVVRGLPEFNDPNLLIGADGASDAGVYRLRDDLLIAQTVDFFPPLVDDPFVFGQIAATNSLSDIYAMGGDPITALNVVGFPDDQLGLDVLGEILRGGAERVLQAGAVIVGGHTVRDTEIKYGLSVTGIVTPEQLMTNRNAQPGDALVLTKPLGTGFVTTAYKAGRCPDATLAAAVESMIQLNVIGRDAARHAEARAATDITGFGLAIHAAEMAQASGVTVVLELDKIPILPGAETLVEQGFKTRASASNRQFAETLMQVEGNPDPIRMDLAFDAQTSGGLLISVPADKADSVVQNVRAAGAHSACIVGSVVQRQAEWLILRGGR